LKHTSLLDAEEKRYDSGAALGSSEIWISHIT
jgi:hypothetical protein